MNRGHYVYFRNLTDAVELKELNDVLNDMLKIMWEKLDVGNPFKTHVFTSELQCAQGEWTTVNFDVEFVDQPSAVAYSPDGHAVKTSFDGVNSKKSIKVSFTDTTLSGKINVLVTGRIKA